MRGRIFCPKKILHKKMKSIIDIYMKVELETSTNISTLNFKFYKVT